jgi:hypothetical protein
MAKNDKPDAPKRAHKATYATDKRKGGYLVRVIGPHAASFVGREIPITRRDDTESTETLERLIWTGIDKGTPENPGTGKPAALYSFKAKPRDEADEIPF